jgi:hypothetical protein
MAVEIDRKLLVREQVEQAIASSYRTWGYLRFNPERPALRSHYGVFVARAGRPCDGGVRGTVWRYTGRADARGVNGVRFPPAEG